LNKTIDEENINVTPFNPSLGEGPFVPDGEIKKKNFYMTGFDFRASNEKNNLFKEIDKPLTAYIDTERYFGCKGNLITKAKNIALQTK
jgi:hypothetical protein